MMLQKKTYIKELADNQGEMLREACRHTKLLSESRQEECIDIIKNKSADEAFVYFEDSNIKDYVIIDDMLCAAKDKTGYKVFENDNPVCSALKKILIN